jgi:hypothetical protein
VGAVAVEPAPFEDLLRDSALGWVRLQAHDDIEAAKHLPEGPSRARAQLNRALLQDDLAGLTMAVHTARFETWGAQGELPAGSARAIAWSASCDQPPAVGDVETARATAHEAARSGQLDDLWAATEPLWQTRDNGTEVDHIWFDPCRHHALAAGLHQLALTSLGQPDWAAPALAEAGLAGTIFAPWLDANGLLQDARADNPAALGNSAAASEGLIEAVGIESDDALKTVRELDAALAERSTTLQAQATPDGLRLLHDLQLVAHWRQRWLVVAARQALAGDHADAANVYASAALTPGKGAGPWNDPAIYVLLARAAVDRGRAREALDTLHSVSHLNGVPGLEEALGDLVILRGLDRVGDSKEN